MPAFLESLAKFRHPLSTVAPGIQHKQPLSGAPAALGRNPKRALPWPALPQVPPLTESQQEGDQNPRKIHRKREK